MANKKPKTNGNKLPGTISLKTNVYPAPITPEEWEEFRAIIAEKDRDASYVIRRLIKLFIENPEILNFDDSSTSQNSPAASRDEKIPAVG